MGKHIKCPKCGSPDVLFSPKRGEYICEDCRHAFQAEKPVEAMRIFLSYGHDSNEPLVSRIKSDLEQRGHDVWFDKSEIKSGHDWRRSITDGIAGSQRVLSFLSEHSTRDPGVCLDEIAIAIGVKGGNIQTILVESEQQVRPPASISHIQWLDMHDWKERRDRSLGTRPEDRAASEAEWEKWYQEKLCEIIAVVESDESRRFAGEIEQLAGHLKPISSDPRIHELLRKEFVGREWLFEATQQRRSAADRGSRLFCIVGDPGVGKSTFAAHLAHYGRDKVIAVQFCQYDKPDHRSAHRIVRTLAFQIATRLPDYRKLLLTLPEIKADQLDRKNAAELFDYLLAAPLRHAIDGGRQRYLIVIDALDEAAEDGRNELVEMLAQHAARLPDWIGIVVTSRPESHVMAPLQGLNPLVLDTATESNRADIRQYVRHELAAQLENRPDSERCVEQILAKSEGVFLYVEHVCHECQCGNLSLDRLDEFPQGLGGVFFQYFQRQFPDLQKFRKDVRPALRAILAAREPLPLEILQRLFDWQDEELRDFIRPLGSLFTVTSESGFETIRSYHKSLADWLADNAKAGPYCVSMMDGHKTLAESGWRDFNEDRNLSEYFRSHLAAHLLLAKRTKEFHELIQSPKISELAKSKPHTTKSEIHLIDRVSAKLSRGLRACVEGVKSKISARPRVFLCYARSDCETARRIGDFLRRDFNVFCDMAHVSSEDFESTLFAQIDRAASGGYVLVLLSPALLESSSWWTEVEHALHSSTKIGRHSVVPVLVAPLERANWPPKLSTVKWFNLTSGSFQERMEELTRNLKRRELE